MPACLYDVHGNPPALDAVLEDAAARGADRYLLDGDPRAAYAPIDPDGTVEHRRVAYDHAAAAQRLREAFPGAAWALTAARRVEQARFDAA